MYNTCVYTHRRQNVFFNCTLKTYFNSFQSGDDGFELHLHTRTRTRIIQYTPTTVNSAGRDLIAVLATEKTGKNNETERKKKHSSRARILVIKLHQFVQIGTPIINTGI